MRGADTDQCTYYGKTDDVEHTLFTCTRWKEDRHVYKPTTGFVFNLENMSQGLTTRKEAWSNMYDCVRRIIKTKEREERQLAS